MESQRIFLTGASSGIGAATAELALKQGHRVWGMARSAGQLAELVERFPGAAGYPLGDVRDAAAVQEAVAAAAAEWGGLDAAVPNAGVGMFNPLESAPLAEWTQMVEVNVVGVLNVVHAVLPHLLESGGTLVNIGSVAARNVFANSGVYCATKHAVLAISEALRIECGGRIGVTTGNPGAVHTPFIDATQNAELRENYRGQFEAGLDPQVIAEAVLLAIGSKGRAVYSELTVRPDRRA
jgi:NADP-dependent 3-hydroxy acid dehydrogenase YdfG